MYVTVYVCMHEMEVNKDCSVFHFQYSCRRFIGELQTIQIEKSWKQCNKAFYLSNSSVAVACVGAIWWFSGVIGMASELHAVVMSVIVFQGYSQTLYKCLGDLKPKQFWYARDCFGHIIFGNHWRLLLRVNNVFMTQAHVYNNFSCINGLLWIMSSNTYTAVINVFRKRAIW